MFYRNLKKKKELTSATFTDKSATARQSEKADKKMNISFFFFFLFSPLHMLEQLD